MKLNRRVRLLILPVLVTSFLSIATAVYLVERQSILSLQTSVAELEATELAGSMSQYAIVGKSFLSSLIKSDAIRYFLDSNDDHFKSLAISSGLDGMLNNLADLSADHFSITFICGTGETEYYYENSLDPFSEPDEYLHEWAKELFTGHVATASMYNQERKRIIFGHVVDRLTLKPPLDFSTANTIAILVELSPTAFIRRCADLKENKRLVRFWGNMELPPGREGLEARRLVRGLGTVGVTIDHQIVRNSLTHVFMRLTAGFAIFTAVTYLVLHWLLQRYVVGPINRLERQMSQVDLEATEEIEVISSEDEIGNLSRSFAGLYGKLKETYEGTRDLAERDTLTNLYNRRVFNLILEKLVDRAGQDKSRVALIYIDIDNFKYVNDHFGHSTGDALLRSFALRLHEIVRGSDFVYKKYGLASTTARLAGDEFAVIVHSYSEDYVPGKVAERILALCDNGFTCEEGTFPVSLSIGVSAYPEDGGDAAALVESADSAMYHSKKVARIVFHFTLLSTIFHPEESLFEYLMICSLPAWESVGTLLCIEISFIRIC